MPMTSANATTLKVKSAISDIREEDGPHGSFEVASRTYASICKKEKSQVKKKEVVLCHWIYIKTNKHQHEENCGSFTIPWSLLRNSCAQYSSPAGAGLKLSWRHVMKDVEGQKMKNKYSTGEEKGCERGSVDWRRRGTGAVAMAMKAPCLCQELQDAPIRKRDNSTQIRIAGHWIFLPISNMLIFYNSIGQ